MSPHRSTLLFSAITGFLLWALSPAITGHNEPWDAPYPFYSIVLIGAGALWALIRRRREPVGILGVWLGQVLALCVLPWLDRSAVIVGAVTTAVGSLFFLLGNAIIAALVRKK